MHGHKKKENQGKLNFLLQSYLTSRFHEGGIKHNKKSICPSISSFFNFSNKIKKLSFDDNFLIVHLHFTKRNTRILISDEKGTPLFNITTGLLGTKKAKRGDPFFVTNLFLKFSDYFNKTGSNFFILHLKGFSRSRRPLLRLFSKSDIRRKCVGIFDKTVVPHNGCRVRTNRRL